MKTKKENLTLIIGIMIVLGTHLVSCERIPGGEPKDPELKPSVEFSVTPQGVIPYGGSVDIIWDADDNTNKVVVKVGGEIVETRYGSNSRQGGVSVSPLTDDVFVTIVVTNINLSVQEEKEIRVGAWMDSTFGLVSYYPWRYNALSVSDLDGKELATWEPDEEMQSWVFRFYKDGRMEVDGDAVLWFLPDNNTISINNSVRKLQVTQEKMIISYQTIWNGQSVWFNMIFEHASDIPTDE